MYFVREDAILCLYRIGSKVADRLFVGAAGGHFEGSEMNDPEACILREIREELDLDPKGILNLKLRYVTHRLKNGEIRQNYYFFAQLKDDSVINTSNEGQLKWFSIEDILSLDMPFTSKKVTDHWVKEGRYTDKFYGGVATFNDMVFVEMNEF